MIPLSNRFERAPLKMAFPLLAQGVGQGEVCKTSKHHLPEVPPCLRGDDHFHPLWRLTAAWGTPFRFSQILLTLLFLSRTPPAVFAVQFELTPIVDQLLRSGLNDMYHYDLESAGTKFDELIRLFPNHPVGYMHKAEIIWWKAIRDPKNKSLEETFDRYTAQAIEKGLSAVNQNPKDFYALLYLASAYGNRTRYSVYISRNYLRAMGAGMKGYRYLKPAYALRKDYVDCLIGIGAYNYFAGALPEVIKPFAWMVGARGDKNEGIKQLELAAEKGEYGKTEAKTVLLGAYYNEKRFDDQKKLLLGLIEQYPSNHVFYLWMTKFFMEQKKIEEGIDFFGQLIKRGNDAPGLRVDVGFAYYEKARLEFEKRAFDNSISSLNYIIEARQTEDGLKARARLLRANACDLKGNRSCATDDYQAVLKLPVVEESHEKARRYLSRPYRGAS